MSYSISIYSVSGVKTTEVPMPTVVSDEQINHSLLHEYVLMYLSNNRQNTAKAKTRAEIMGSGRKLFRQKGTGRARVGSANSPIRRKGGVAFGPSPERNWQKKMNQKMRQKAFAGSLALQLQKQGVKGIEGLSFVAPKTKDAYAVLLGLHLEDKKVLIVDVQDSGVVYRSFRNIPNVSVASIATVNPYDILTHKEIVFTDRALEVLPTRFHLLVK